MHLSKLISKLKEMQVKFDYDPDVYLGMDDPHRHHEFDGTEFHYTCEEFRVFTTGSHPNSVQKTVWLEGFAE